MLLCIVLNTSFHNNYELFLLIQLSYLRPFLGNELCAVVTGVDMTMTVLVCTCEVVKRGVLSFMFMIPPVALVAVAGSDNEGADDTWVDNWVPVDNRGDADDEGVIDDGQVNEVVVDAEVVDNNVEVSEGVVNDEDDKSWAADEGMLSVGGLEEEVPVW